MDVIHVCTTTPKHQRHWSLFKICNKTLSSRHYSKQITVQIVLNCCWIREYFYISFHESGVAKSFGKEQYHCLLQLR